MESLQSSYVGIDPSLSKTGVAILTNGNLTTFTLRSPEKGVHRLQNFRDQLVNMLPKSTHTVCIESGAYNAINRADDLGQLRGVLAVCALDVCSRIHLVPPTTLKKFATGTGAASKEKMIRSALRKWNQTLTDDEADAAWLAFLAHGLAIDIPLKRYQMEVIRGIRYPKAKRRVSTRKSNNI
jgi:crossover junction endodeoxyribonuclease RuvC